MKKVTITHRQLKSLARPLDLWTERDLEIDGHKLRLFRRIAGYECSLFYPGSTIADETSKIFKCADRAIIAVAGVRYEKPGENRPQWPQSGRKG